MVTEREREMVEQILKKVTEMEKKVTKLGDSVKEFRNEFKEFSTEMRVFNSEFLNRQKEIGNSLNNIIELNKNRKSAKEIVEGIAGKGK